VAKMRSTMLELTLPSMACGHCVSVVTKVIRQTDPQAFVRLISPATVCASRPLKTARRSRRRLSRRDTCQGDDQGDRPGCLPTLQCIALLRGRERRDVD
jgi:copper chaperone CopZ